MAVHRRVDNSAEHEDEGAVARGDDPEAPGRCGVMTLSSHGAGFDGDAGLGGGGGEVAVPVEYRKGHPHHPYAQRRTDDPGEGEALAPAAEPGRGPRAGGVSVAAAGGGGVSSVPEAVLYYAARSCGYDCRWMRRCGARRDTLGRHSSARRGRGRRPWSRSAVRAMLAAADLPTG